jgi:hypothetical protein
MKKPVPPPAKPRPNLPSKTTPRGGAAVQRAPLRPPAQGFALAREAHPARTDARAKASGHAQAKAPARAPAPYRPQPVPKVLQTKAARAGQVAAPPAPKRPQAPPAYRPQPTPAVLQLKLDAAASAQARPAPPVYRPQPVPKVLQARTPRADEAAHARTQVRVSNPPVRPAHGAGASALQPKMRAGVVAPPRPPARGVIQCDGIKFKNRYGRTLTKDAVAVKDLKTWQLEFIALDPHDQRIEFVGNKMTVLDSIKKRLKDIQEAKLKRSMGSGKGYESGTDRYVVAIHPYPNTPTRQELEEEFESLPFEVVWPKSSYSYGSYPSEVTNSPGGTEVNRSGVYGNQSPGGTFSGLAFYSSTYPEVKPNYTPVTPVKLTKTPIKMSGGFKTSGWQRIDKARLKRWLGVRKGYKPGTGMDSGERSGQDAAMGNISAKEAAAHSGYTKGAWDWLHLIAFTFGGIGEKKVNHSDNLVAGTMEANRQHKVVEDTVKKLLIDGLTEEVYVNAVATLEPNSYHLAKKLEYVIKFKIGLLGSENTYTYSIECLNPNPAQGGNMNMLTSILVSLGK